MTVKEELTEVVAALQEMLEALQFNTFVAHADEANQANRAEYFGHIDQMPQYRNRREHCKKAFARFIDEGDKDYGESSFEHFFAELFSQAYRDVMAGRKSKLSIFGKDLLQRAATLGEVSDVTALSRTGMESGRMKAVAATTAGSMFAQTAADILPHLGIFVRLILGGARDQLITTAIEDEYGVTEAGSLNDLVQNIMSGQAKHAHDGAAAASTVDSEQSGVSALGEYLRRGGGVTETFDFFMDFKQGFAKFKGQELPPSADCEQMIGYFQHLFALGDHHDKVLFELSVVFAFCMTLPMELAALNINTKMTEMMTQFLPMLKTRFESMSQAQRQAFLPKMMKKAGRTDAAQERDLNESAKRIFAAWFGKLPQS